MKMAVTNAAEAMEDAMKAVENAAWNAYLEQRDAYFEIRAAATAAAMVGWTAADSEAVRAAMVGWTAAVKTAVKATAMATEMVKNAVEGMEAEEVVEGTANAAEMVNNAVEGMARAAKAVKAVVEEAKTETVKTAATTAWSAVDGVHALMMSMRAKLSQKTKDMQSSNHP